MRGEHQPVRAACHRYGMPLMIEPLVMLPNEVRGGYQVDGDAEKIVTLVRLAAEMGADIIKADPTDDPEDFHRVVEAARVPVLVRGGGKEDLKTVLAKSAALMKQGAQGHGLWPQHLPARQPEGGGQRADGDDPSRAPAAKRPGTSTTVADRAAICSASTPATPSSRRCCSTCTGRQLAMHARRRPLAHAAPGHVERDLDELWANARDGHPRLHRAGRHRPATRSPRSAAPAMATASTCSTGPARR